MLSDRFNCSKGDCVALMLFSLFRNELAVKVIRNGKHGISLPINYLELFIL